MSGTAQDAMDGAREYLNDAAGTIWTNAALFPKLREAHRQFAVRLQLAGIPVIKAVSVVLSVPARTTALHTVSGYPFLMIEPKWLKERKPGGRNSDFRDMKQCDFIPNQEMGIDLVWWCWREQKISLLGATVPTEVEIRYLKGLDPLLVGADFLGYPYAENYLAPKTASLAATATESTQAAQDWNAEAEKALTDIIRMNIRGLQNLPARRIGYHRGRAGF